MFNVTFYPQTQYILCAMRRSGQHAVINWLKPILNYHYHFNDCSPLHYPTMNLNPKDKWYSARLNTLPSLTHNSSVIINLESKSIQICLQSIQFHSHPTTTIIPILLLRDPFNSFAGETVFPKLFRKSKSLQDQSNLILSLRNTWIDHANQFLNPSSPFIPINYNSWFSSQPYRQSISQKFNKTFDDSNFSTMIKYSPGHSLFQPNLPDNSQLTPFIRWQSTITNPIFIQFLSPTVFSLAKQIFPEFLYHDQIYNSWLNSPHPKLPE